MTDLRERLHGVDRIHVPDLWEEVLGRASSPERDTSVEAARSEPFAWRRPVTIIAAFAVFIAAGVLVWQALGPSASTPGIGPSVPDSITNPMGLPITLSYPPGWFAGLVAPDPRQTGGSSPSGVVISNSARVMPSSSPSQGPIQYQALGRDTVIVWVLENPTSVSPGPDSPLPLSMANAGVIPGPGNIRVLDAQVAGVPLEIGVKSGSDASKDDLASADAIVASIASSTHQPRIWIDSRDGVFFDPPPGDAHPLLTADQALARFKDVDRAFSIRVRQGELGVYTAPPQFSGRLAYGYAFPLCLGSPNPVATPSFEPVGGCTSWLFLDANTGSMLEARQQLG
jgi:hypothetical protein